MNQLNSSAERIRFARGLLGLSRLTLQEKYDISLHTISSWENGRLTLSQKGADQLSKLFIKLGLMCPATWLLCKNDERPYFLDDASAYTDKLGENLCVLREIEAFKTINPNPIVIMVSDDGMLPRYEPGSYIGGNLRTGDEIKNLIGTNCIIKTKSDDLFFRRLLPGQSESTYALTCLNPSTNQEPIIMNLKIVAAAQVVWHRDIEKSL